MMETFRHELATPVDPVVADTPSDDSPVDSAAPTAGESSGMVVQAIPLAAVRTEPGWNVRVVRLEDQDIQDLADSLDAFGLLQPIVVLPEPDGTYRLISGHRRVAAATLLNWSTIPAHILTAERARDAEELLVTENVQRRELSPLEEAAGYRRLQAKGHSLRAIARITGRSTAQVSLLLRMTAYPPLQRALAEETVTRSQARELLRLLDAEGNPVRPDVIEEVLEWVARQRPTVAALQAKVDAILAGQPVRRPQVPKSWADYVRRQSAWVARRAARADLAELVAAESALTEALAAVQAERQRRLAHSPNASSDA